MDKRGIARAEATAECGLTILCTLGGLEHDWRTVAPSEGLSAFPANAQGMFLRSTDWLETISSLVREARWVSLIAIN